MELLQEIRQKGLEPNVNTYSTAISACEKAKLPDRAIELLEEMQQKGLTGLQWPRRVLHRTPLV